MGKLWHMFPRIHNLDASERNYSWAIIIFTSVNNWDVTYYVVTFLNCIRYATGPILPEHQPYWLFPTSERPPSILTGPNFSQHTGHLDWVFSQLSLVALWANCKFWDSTGVCQNRLVTHSTACSVWYRRHLKITKPMTRRTSWPQHDTVQ